ncbi:MAG: hypothetical protein ACC656_13045 [Candidatus Heimdallarchaeota archaeon]
MPWLNSDFKNMVSKAKLMISTELNIPLENLITPVFTTTLGEIAQAVLVVLQHKNYGEAQIDYIESQLLPNVVGKYFSLKREIWVLQDKGENIETIVHELLHSVQKCSPNREGIVDYITFKITGVSSFMSSYHLANWQEIERTDSFEAIKDRLSNKGDCEDF